MQDGLDVINGRHRLWMAQQCGISSLPALVARKNEGADHTNINGGSMGTELREIEETAEQQENRAGELKEEIDAHQERVEKLDAAVKELQSGMDGVNSEESRSALEAMQNTRRETERLLEEKRQEQQTLLEENERMGKENTESYQKAQQAMEKVESIVKIAGGDEGNLAGHLSEMQSSLQQDIEHRLDADRALLQAKQKLQMLF
jgi:hypothetical protein